jgi:hypothetical protein
MLKKTTKNGRWAVVGRGSWGNSGSGTGRCTEAGLRGDDGGSAALAEAPGAASSRGDRGDGGGGAGRGDGGAPCRRRWCDRRIRHPDSALGKL